MNHKTLNPWLQPEPLNWWQIVDDAVGEDVGYGDVTAGCIDPDDLTRWRIEAQGEGTIAGIGIAEHLLGPGPGEPEECFIELNRSDGDSVSRGDIVLEGVTSTRKALIVERTALNFLMRLSGVATLTRAFVDRVEGLDTKIIDTRKTTPGLRALEKYAVRCGGGHNHRMGLYDGALVKDNHIVAAGSITAAVEKIRSYASHMIKIEVECETLEQVEEAIKVGADIVLLDNMDPFMMREAVHTHRGKCIFEASGGVSLDTVKGVAMTGVQLIAVGQITHSAPSLSFHMEFDPL